MPYRTLSKVNERKYRPSPWTPAIVGEAAVRIFVLIVALSWEVVNGFSTAFYIHNLHKEIFTVL